VKWRVTTIWLNEAQSVRFWPDISCLERAAGVGMMTALQCDDDWLGGRITPCSRCLTARSDCQTQQDSDNGDEPGKFKGSVLKLELPAILLAHLIKGKKVNVTCSYAQEKKKTLSTSASSNSNLMKQHKHMRAPEPKYINIVFCLLCSRPKIQLQRFALLNGQISLCFVLPKFTRVS